MTTSKKEDVKEAEEYVKGHFQALKASYEIAKGQFVHDFGIACIQYQEVPSFFLDGTVRPPPGDASILVTRLIMTPTTLKSLRRLIDKAISDFEAEYGEIKLEEEEIVHYDKEE
jgi:hypothetical protein